VLATARFDGSRLGPVEIFPDPPPGEVGIPAWGSR